MEREESNLMGDEEKKPKQPFDRLQTFYSPQQTVIDILEYESPKKFEFSSPSFRHPWFGVIVAGLYFFTACCVMATIMNFVNNRVPTELASLPDLGHEWLPFLRPESLGDIVLGLLIVCWIFFAVLVVEHHQIPRILIKWLLCHGTLFFFRIITISVTSLPVTQNHCREHYSKIAKTGWNTFLGIISFGSLNQHCGDLLFSGHSVVISLVCLFFGDYCRRVGKNLAYDFAVIVIRSGIYFLALVACLLILATRNHYTVDVVIGIYLTITTYKLMPDQWPFSPFTRLRWFQ